MLNYSTEFPLDTKNSIDDVIGLASRWLAASPHTKLDTKSFRDIPDDKEVILHQGGETVRIAKTSLEAIAIGGIRYVREERNGLVWTSSIVGLKTENEVLLSIQVSCEANNTAISLPAPKKPYIVGQAIRELGGGMDGSVPVADRAFNLTSKMPAEAAALILGVGKNRLPIIYVSAGFDNRYVLDPNRLAALVAGMAHVIVEPNRRFSQQLRKLVDADNVYGGAVGVYWPYSSVHKAYIGNDGRRAAETLELEIAKDVRVALSHRRLRSNCTWDYLQEALSSRKYDLLRSQGATGLEEYITAFDAEIVAKNARLDDAEREIARLNAEINRLVRSAKGKQGGPLSSGKEQDLYSGESNDIVISALRDALRNTHQNSRRQHVLEDLIAANMSNGSGEDLARQVKQVLKDYVDMDAKTKSELTALGFDISQDGKHYKAIYQGDSRYTFSISKTGSDHRAGKNLASDICKTIF